MIDTHDDLPGEAPFEEDPSLDGSRRASALRLARVRAMTREAWIADEFEFIEKELANLSNRIAKRPKGKQPVIFLQSPGEVLDAVKLGVVDKTEARQLLGLKKRRQPRGLRRARTGGN